MSKEVVARIKLQIVAGQASPAPPVGPALGQHGVNIMQFVREFNERTRQDGGGDGRPRRHHDLQGQELHLHPEDAPRPPTC